MKERKKGRDRRLVKIHVKGRPKGGGKEARSRGGQLEAVNEAIPRDREREREKKKKKKKQDG